MAVPREKIACSFYIRKKLLEDDNVKVHFATNNIKEHSPSERLLDLKAKDPESNPFSFSKVSQPHWASSSICKLISIKYLLRLQSDFLVLKSVSLMRGKGMVIMNPKEANVLKLSLSHPFFFLIYSKDK